MTNILEQIFGKSWRTAIMGYAGAVFFAIEPILQNGNFNIKRDWPNLVAAGGAALFGNVAKDAKVTGPTNEQAAVSQELKLAQEALDAAKLSGNAKLIEIAQAVVDGLKKGS